MVSLAEHREGGQQLLTLRRFIPTRVGRTPTWCSNKCRFNPLLLLRGGETCPHNPDPRCPMFQSAPPLTRRRNPSWRAQFQDGVEFQSAPPLTRRRNAYGREPLTEMNWFQSAPPLTRRRNFEPRRCPVARYSFNPLLLLRGGETTIFAKEHPHTLFQSAPPLTRRRNDKRGAVCMSTSCFNPLLLLRGGETSASRSTVIPSIVSIRSSSYEEEKQPQPILLADERGFNPLLLLRGGETTGKTMMGLLKVCFNPLLLLRGGETISDPPFFVLRAFQSAPPLTRRRNAKSTKDLVEGLSFNPLLLLRGGETVALQLQRGTQVTPLNPRTGSPQPSV